MQNFYLLSTKPGCNYNGRACFLLSQKNLYSFFRSSSKLYDSGNNPWELTYKIMGGNIILRKIVVTKPHLPPLLLNRKEYKTLLDHRKIYRRIKMRGKPMESTVEEKTKIRALLSLTLLIVITILLYII